MINMFVGTHLSTYGNLALVLLSLRLLCSLVMHECRLQISPLCMLVGIPMKGVMVG